MKTLTEFSGTMIRMAARAEAEARKTIPKELLAVAPAPVPAEGVTAKPDETASEAPPTATADSVTDAVDQALAGTNLGAATHSEPKPGEAGTTEDEMQPGAAEEEAREEAAAGQDLAGSGQVAASEPEPVAKAELESETSAVKEILDKAVAEATGTTGDRLARLREALQAAGRQAERVRLVRVFGVEEEVAGAKKIGEFQYIVDLMPNSMKQNFEQNDRDKRRGPKRPSGGKGKDSGTLEGSFSMESLAQDRRAERGGPGGGGRGGKPGGGGRPGGGGGRGRPGGGGGGRGPKPGGAPHKP
jgi:translation initiation factor IF-2